MLIVIVGCGGTGSNLAPYLSRMMENGKMLLVDGDIVEGKNIIRQTFQTFDVGANKARALARKLNSNFRNNHYFIDKYLESSGELIERINNFYLSMEETIIICGCVDNNATRLLLEDAYTKLKENYPNTHYVDSGNEDTFGTVLVDVLRSSFMEMDSSDHPLNHCGNEIAEGNAQQYQINLDMALAVAKVVFALERNERVPSCIKINGYERTAEY